MKVLVQARYVVTEVFELELDVDEDWSDKEIEDKCWDAAYDYVGNYDGGNVYDLEWERK